MCYRHNKIGHVNLLLSSSMKYTCLRIHFTGLVTTKVAKTEEQVYVLKQQVVLLGQANNATEHSLEKGQHSWPFQFTIPLQHLPSSGKVRLPSLSDMKRMTWYGIIDVQEAFFL